jgi:hypothetical protein
MIKNGIGELMSSFTNRAGHTRALRKRNAATIKWEPAVVSNAKMWRREQAEHMLDNTISNNKSVASSER